MRFNWPIPPNLIPADLEAGLRFGVSRTTTATPHKHKGVDLVWGQEGQTVLAAQSGTIYKAYAYTALGGPGIIDIDHGVENGVQWRTRYLHVDPNSFSEYGVKTGTLVMSGQPIARVGKLSSGAHLHFEVRSCNGGCAWPTGWTANDPVSLLGGTGATSGQLFFVVAVGAAVYFMLRG